MSFPRFSDFLNEDYPTPYRNDNLYFNFGKKVNVFSKHSWFRPDPFTGIDQVYDLASKELFNAIIDKEYFTNKVDIDSSLPALGFDRYLTQIMIDEGYPIELIYNHPDESIILKKVNLYKELQKLNSDALPKTVFNRDQVLELTFPIIAKNENSWQSKGVEKFDAVEDMADSKIKFDVFQEAIEIEKEWRSLVFKGKNGETKVLAIFLRTPMEGKAQSLRVTESFEDRANLKGNESAHFQWKQIDIFEDQSPDNPDFNQVAKLIKEVGQICPGMNLYSVDFARDKSGKIWHLECNTQPGMSGMCSVLVYLNILKDFYGISMMKDDKSNIQSIIYRLIEFTKKGLPGYEVPLRLMQDELAWFGKKVE